MYMWTLAQRRQKQARRDPGNLVFGNIGWLFADLMLALAIAFLVAETVGQPPLPRTTPSSSPFPSPSVSTSRSPEPVLELKPVKIELTIEWQSLLAKNRRTTESLERRIRKDSHLVDRRAGLVLTFGGARGGDDDRAIMIAEQVNRVLGKLGREGFVFRNTVYRRFLDLSAAPSRLLIEVYLFKK